MANPGAIYTDGDYTAVLFTRLPELSAPIPGINKDYVLKQECAQLEANFTSLALNTAYPNTAGGGDDLYTSYLLVEEGPRQDIGAGVVKWTRTYAKVPDTHYDPCQISFQFPGFLAAGNGLALLRNPFTRSVPGTIEYAYFLAGTNTQSAIQSLETSNFVSEQRFLWPRPTLDVPLPDEALIVDYIWSSISPEPTVPTLETYAAWVSSGTNTIVAQPSQFDRWMGNILRRQVITILPA